MKLSIVIPTFNRASDLMETLDSFSKQSLLTSEYEIIIVDNGPSTDFTSSVVRESSLDNIRYVKTSLKGVAFARRMGNSLAKGNIILQVDDDISLVDHDTLSELIHIFEVNKGKIDVLGALEIKDKSMFSKISISSFPDPQEHIFIQYPLAQIGQIDSFFNLFTGFEKMISLPRAFYRVTSFRSCFMVFRKRILGIVGEWDSNYAYVGGKISVREETDFLLRLRAHGAKIYYTNSLSFYHRCGVRDPRLGQRDGRIGKSFHYSAAHSYMVLKYFLDFGLDSKKQLLWFPYQLLVGGEKNPGFIRSLFNLGILSALSSVFGFIYGHIFALVFKRSRDKRIESYINNI